MCVCVSTPVSKECQQGRGATTGLPTLPNEATEDWWMHSGTPECVPAQFLIRSSCVLPCSFKKSVQTPSTLLTHRLSVCIPFQSWSDACKVGLRTDPSSCEQQSKCMYVCLYVRLYLCMAVCLSVSLSVCLSVCLYVCMYVHTDSSTCRSALTPMDAAETLPDNDSWL